MKGKCVSCGKVREIFKASRRCAACKFSERKWLGKTLEHFWDRLEGEIQKSGKDFIDERVPPFLDEKYKEEYLKRGMRLLKKVQEND